MNGRIKEEDHTLTRMPITNCTIAVLLERGGKYLLKKYGIQPGKFCFSI